MATAANTPLVSREQVEDLLTEDLENAWPAAARELDDALANEDAEISDLVFALADTLLQRVARNEDA